MKASSVQNALSFTVSADAVRTPLAAQNTNAISTKLFFVQSLGRMSLRIDRVNGISELLYRRIRASLSKTPAR